MNMNLDYALSNYIDVMSRRLNGKYRETTRNTYISCFRSFLEYLRERGVARADKVDRKYIEEYFVEKRLVNDYRQFIKYVSAIRIFENEVLGIKKALIYGDTEKTLFSDANRNKKYNAGGSGLEGNTIERKINGMHNQKMKLAMRLGLRSGLRVSELAAVKKDDVKFTDGEINVVVRDGKGGKGRVVECLEDQYLYGKLEEYINGSGSDKLFYSASYMKSSAEKLGFEMHDLRRCYSKTYIKKCVAEGKTRNEAKQQLMKNLGHEDAATTDIYLKKKR